MTSLPVTPWRTPVKVTFAIGGICHHVLPVAHMLAASVYTTGIPKDPTPPYMLLWLSEATVRVPGHA